VVSLGVVIVPSIGPPFSGLIAAAALSALCYSFFVDVVWLWRHTNVALVTTPTVDGPSATRLAPLG
jgi:hypothetical protein